MGERGAATRRKIADAALQVLREEGARGLTMRQVAVRAGLALSNLQYHYPSREALLAGLVDCHLAACDEAMQRGLQEGVGDPLLETLRVSLCDSEVLASARVFRELFALAEQDLGVRQRLHAHFRVMLEDAVNGMAALGTGLPRESLTEVATVLLTSIEGYYLLSEVTPVSGERLAVVLADLAVSMLTAR